MGASRMHRNKVFRAKLNRNGTRTIFNKFKHKQQNQEETAKKYCKI